MSKSFVDYFGFYKSNYFEFDVKETSKEYFDKALLQKHQIQRLEKLNEMNIKGFVLVYFSLKEEFYVIDYKVFINHTKNKMDYEFIRTNCHELKIIYPGILDLISYL
jgi:recombination protein U